MNNGSVSSDDCIVSSVLEQITGEYGLAYMIVDRSYRVRQVGGNTAVLGACPPAPGDMLLELLPELLGNETLLEEILTGTRARLRLPNINRDDHENGVRYYDLLTLPHIDQQGQIDGLLQLITDVTERGIIEQTYVQQRNELRLLKERITQQNIELARINAELRRASRLKDEFLAGISHEVRTPLAAVLGLAELLRTRVVGPVNVEQAEILQRIDESGRHLLAVINDLLDLAKIDAGRFDLELNLVSTRHLCESSVRMVHELAIRKSQTVSLNVDPCVTTIRVDERRLRQALINLLSNAVKFTPPGGSIGLDVQGDPDGEAVRFTVWDTGIGIAAEDIARLFVPFSQVDGEHQRGQTGSGLGLALVARLAELHGGGVGLTSQPGQGSRFTLSLPWRHEEQHYEVVSPSLTARPTAPDTPGDEEVALPRASAGQRLLLVDDDVAGAAMVNDYLRRCGYSVTLATSGEEAIEHVHQELPHAMVVDLRMRGMDGLEVIRRMRAGIPTRATPIVALTALAMPGDRERCLEAGANVYLSKPVRLRQLADTIATLLDQH